MSVKNMPSGNADYVNVLRAFQPTGSSTWVHVMNMDTGQGYRLVNWGNDIYLPVNDGDRIGIVVYNGSGAWRGYPCYVEALNIWQGGQSEPEECDTEHMWELRPHESMTIDALMNPGSQKGRPLQIVTSGEGFAIGESTFGTTQWRGQIRLYERLQVGGGYQAERETNKGSGFDRRPMTYDDTLESATLGGMRGGGETRGGAAIGAGREEARSHRQTGVRYQRKAQPVVYLRTELRNDLYDMLRAKLGVNWDWFYSIPTYGFWQQEPWSDWQSPAASVAPQVPLAPRPHTGRP